MPVFFNSIALNLQSAYIDFSIVGNTFSIMKDNPYKERKMRKCYLLGFAVFAALFTSSACYAGDAMHCVHTYTDGKYGVFQNTCNHNIFVSYCGVDKAYSGKRCGEYHGGEMGKGTFYTH